LDVLSKVIFNEKGFMTNSTEWTKEIAQALAEQEGLFELNDIHWKIIEFSREFSKKSGNSPALRVITAGVGITTKELFTLFPKGPSRKIARISGLERSEGCV
jgi:TusE/DsrC/DsvC family sulfur relay protein